MQSRLTDQARHDVRVTMFPAAYEVMLREASVSERDGLETGGILLGRESPDGSLFVDVAGGPGPRAARSRNRFNRDLAYSTALAAEAWVEHGAEWIGDWHTHPHGDPRPSGFDLSSYASLLADSELRFRAFLTVIVAPLPPGSSARPFAWIVGPRAVSPVPLSVEATDLNR